MRRLQATLAVVVPAVVCGVLSPTLGASYPFGINVLQQSSGALNTPTFISHDGSGVLGWAFGDRTLENRYSRLGHGVLAQPVRTFTGSSGISSCDEAVSMFAGGARPTPTSAFREAFYMPSSTAAPVFLGRITGFSNSAAYLMTADGQRVSKSWNNLWLQNTL
jgi:hypothetical protein